MLRNTELLGGIIELHRVFLESFASAHDVKNLTLTGISP